VATYSYWHFRTEKVPIETVIDKAAEVGADAVDLLHRQMDLPEWDPLTSDHRRYLQQLKRHAFRRGIDLACLSIHQNFVQQDPAERRKHVEHTEKCIEIAYELGVPCIRLNSGRWNTIKDFDELMKARGVEPVLPGVKESEGFDWCIESIQRCLPKAEQCGVMLALENHWGLSRTPEGLLRILNAIESPWLGALKTPATSSRTPTTNWRRTHLELYVQAKTYYSGGNGTPSSRRQQAHRVNPPPSRLQRLLPPRFEGKENPRPRAKSLAKLPARRSGTTTNLSPAGGLLRRVFPAPGPARQSSSHASRIGQAQR
jgi:hypothetical protein